MRKYLAGEITAMESRDMRSRDRTGELGRTSACGLCGRLGADAPRATRNAPKPRHGPPRAAARRPLDRAGDRGDAVYPRDCLDRLASRGVDFRPLAGREPSDWRGPMGAPRSRRWLTRWLLPPVELIRAGGDYWVGRWPQPRRAGEGARQAPDRRGHHGARYPRARRHGPRPGPRQACREARRRRTVMQYTQLGERGPRVSRIAFGNWSAGGDWGRVDRDAAIAATREALDLGITLFDTARAYGFGAAEQLLGEALAAGDPVGPRVDRHRDQGRPAQGRRRHRPGQQPGRAAPRPRGEPRVPRHRLRRHLPGPLAGPGDAHHDDGRDARWVRPRRSRPLRRRVELRPGADDDVPAGPSRSTRSSRRITCSGATSRRPILPFAREHGIGILVYGPLAHGLLSGRMTTDTTFAADDWRSNERPVHR